MDYGIRYCNMGIYYKHVTNKILDDFVAACRPRWAVLEAEFSVRGGISTTVTATYDAE